MNRYFAVFLAGLAALGQLSCKHKAPPGVAAEINGQAITFAELDKVFQSQYPEPIAESNEDQVLAQRLDLLSRMITTEIMWQHAEKLGITATDALRSTFAVACQSPSLISVGL